MDEICCYDSDQIVDIDEFHSEELFPEVDRPTFLGEESLSEEEDVDISIALQNVFPFQEIEIPNTELPLFPLPDISIESELNDNPDEFGLNYQFYNEPKPLQEKEEEGELSYLDIINERVSRDESSELTFDDFYEPFKPVYTDRPPKAPSDAPKLPYLTQVFIRRSKSNSLKFSRVFPRYLSTRPYKYILKVLSGSKNIRIVCNSNNVLMQSTLKCTTVICDDVYEFIYGISFRLSDRYVSDKRVYMSVVDGNGKCLWSYLENMVEVVARRRKEEIAWWNCFEPNSSFTNKQISSITKQSMEINLKKQYP